MQVGMSEADAPASSTAAQRKTPISTFKALSSASYADRIRPKKNDATPEMSSLSGSGSASLTVTPPGESSGGVVTDGPSRDKAVAAASGPGAASSQPTGNNGKSKADAPVEQDDADEAGWQAVTTRSRTTKGPTRKDQADGGSRWGKRPAGASAGSTDRSGERQSGASRANGRDGWADQEKNETSAAALTSDSWRSSSASRATAGEQKPGESTKRDRAQDKPVLEQQPTQAGSDQETSKAPKEAHQASSQPTVQASMPPSAHAETPSSEEQRPVKPVPVVNVWQARREEQRRAATSAGSTSKPNPSFTTAPQPALGGAAKQTSEVRSDSGGPSPPSQAQGPKPGQPYKTAPPARTAAPIAARDPTAWPEVQSSVVKAANTNVSKAKDDAQSVVSSSEVAPAKKEKTKWIPIPASQLDLTLDPPIRAKKVGSETNARAKRAANGPPERAEKSADSRQSRASTKIGAKTKSSTGKAPVASAASATKKNKDDKASREDAQSLQDQEASGRPNGSVHAEQASLSSGSIVPSELEEGVISAEIVPNGIAHPMHGTERPYNSLAINVGEIDVQGGQHSDAKVNGQIHPAAAARGGLPFRGQRGGQRGGRGGWRGGSSPSGAYTHGYRGRPGITSPGARSTSLPVSGNVSPHLLATYSNLPMDAQYAQGYAYPVPYYSYGAAGYPMYPQEPSSYEQQMLNSFAAFGPPPPMPVSDVPGLDPLRVRVLGQLEYYFGEQNLPMDFFLRQQMDSRGWIDISMVASFNRVKSLSTDLDMIKEVLKLSFVVEVREDKVRLANGKHKAWILPDAAPSPFEDDAGEPSPPIYSGSGLITTELPAEARDKIAGEVTRDVLRSGSSAVLDALSPPQASSKQTPAALKSLEEDEASGSATGTDNNTGHLTPATSVDEEEPASKTHDAVQT